MVKVDNPFEKILGINKQFNKKGILMLNKFEEQDLISAVEKLEEQKKNLDIIISSLKNIKPSLFSYPKVAKYISGKFDPTAIINDD